MRLSEFWRLVDEEFGDARGRLLVRDHVLGSLGHRTAQAALDDGENVRTVWQALCADLEVPREHWFGRDVGAPRSR